MNEYINLDLNNIDEEHICCAIGDPKHQEGVDKKKEWIKNKLKDGHIFRKLNARGKIFIEYEPLETAWVPINGTNYEYIYCLWVAGSFKGKGIGKELLEYAINDAKEKNKSGICTLVSKKKKPFLGEKKFFEHFGFKVVDSIEDYELMALQFDDKEKPKFSETARKMEIDNEDFTIYYSNECPYVEYEITELTDYAKSKNIKLNIIKIDSLEKAKNAPCIINNWANFYKGKFISNTILNANKSNSMKNGLLLNINRIHTTEQGKQRIKNNINLKSIDPVEYCINIVKNKNCIINKKGKNWYCELDNIVITINSYSYTIITAHEKND